MRLNAENDSSFLELSPRERIAALLDDSPSVELLGAFDRIASPWLAPQGLVAQSDDGVAVVRGYIDGKEVVAIAIEPAFEGGSVGEVGGAKIAKALELAAESCRAGRDVAALLLLETGGVRLGEANLGLAAIADIQRAILDLRGMVPVVAMVAGPVGCFGGMSLAAALCTQIVGTKYGRLGMNGPEVIEQEAGPDEMDASDRDAIWKTYGCEARFAAGLIDALVPANAARLAEAVRMAFAKGVLPPKRVAVPAAQVFSLRNVTLPQSKENGHAAFAG